MSKPLEGRVALVTGASSGIGEATARALSAAGAVRSPLVARRRERLDRHWRSAASFAAMARHSSSSPTWRSKTKRSARCMKPRPISAGWTILVNNAGVMYLEPVATADLARWRHMFELNVLGLIAATQAALPGMSARRDGHIVNVSSTAGRVANAGSGGYAATKFGVVAFSEALRKEVYKDGIRVTVIEPGAVATELRQHIAHAPTQQAINAWAESMRQLQPEDVANAIVFCVSQPPHVNINEVLMRPTDQER